MRTGNQWPLLRRCTFIHALLPITLPTIPSRNLSQVTRIVSAPLHSNGILVAKHCRASRSYPSRFFSATPPRFQAINVSKKSTTTTTVPWKRSDAAMLSSLRKKKNITLDEIQIYMPHQPIEVLQSKLQELESGGANTNIKDGSVKKKKPTFQRWTPEEDERLRKAVEEFGSQGRWTEISDLYFLEISDTIEGATMTARSPRSCQIRWNFLQPESGFRQGPWSAEELDLFQELVQPTPQEGDAPVNDWEAISRAMGTRSPIQCHSQFKTVMHSGTKGKWTVEEVNKLLKARELFGNDWQKVAKHVGTRAPGQVRQKWNQFSDDVLLRLQARRTADAAATAAGDKR
ncbi:Transcription factor myb3r-5 [Gryganskiella cystojenkinii]|nr:Transcription factor myb3r-5 [Gryganskiella cystojenkinii]KAG0042362.1 Transcription factor myb3r-5 [Gryganskiella cystojenkinii]